MSTSAGAFLVIEHFTNAGVFQDPGFRNRLIQGDIPKGTVSKMCQVLRALREERLSPEEVTSINGAYALIKSGNLESIKRRVADLSEQDKSALREWLRGGA